MNEKHLHILQHSLGVDQYGRGNQYRKHFCTGPGSKDFEACNELVALGLMIDLGYNALAGEDHVFNVTAAGVEYVAANSPKPPRLTRGQERYQRYLDCDGCCGSFRDFLLYEASLEKEKA